MVYLIDMWQNNVLYLSSVTAVTLLISVQMLAFAGAVLFCGVSLLPHQIHSARSSLLTGQPIRWHKCEGRSIALHTIATQ